jgi:alpha-mannosidase
MKKKNLHLIGNAHIDPVWLWQWQEGFHEVKASFRSALDRMNTYNDFIFVASSAAFYEWVEQSDPEMFREIQQRVSEGRWGIVGGWWIEPDCNIPSGESFVRHSLYGQRYFSEKFGVTAKTGFNIDSFGHAGTLPQILQQAGIENYTFLRPGPHEMELPGRLFQWQSPDGSRVTAFEIPYTYAASGEMLEKFLKEHPEEIPEEYCTWMSFVGVGNHGGGPTIETIEKIHSMNASDEFAQQLLFSKPETFFQEIRESNVELPVVATELQHHASGCYSVHSGIKQWNRRAENALIAAEKWTTISKAALDITAKDSYRHAWKQLLFNQFHDIMAGTSLKESYQDARDQIGEAISIAARNHNLALQAFAWNINLPLQPDAFPIIVFNPLTWPAEDIIELEIGTHHGNYVLLDEHGDRIPHQFVQSHATTWRQRVCFIADLPALGYRTYRLVKVGDEISNPSNDSPLKYSQTSLENSYLSLTIDPQTGAIESLMDKTSNQEFFSGAAGTAVVLDDPGDTWAHGVFEWHDVIDQFKPEQISLFEEGPVKATIRVVSKFNASTVIQDFTLSASSRQIDVTVQINWQEQLKMVKLQFPTTINNGVVTAENAYGHCKRAANGIEEPMQRWVDLSNDKYGLSLLNDGKYSYDIAENIISLTVLRSPVFAHHVPIELQEGGMYTYIDQGWQSFKYVLVPHPGNWKVSGIVTKAEQLNQPPTAMLGTFHPEGKLPQKDSFIHVESDSVLVTVLKESEDGEGIIVRAVETKGNTVSAVIELPLWNCTITDDFKPLEIKTYLIPEDERLPVRPVNILEL